MRRAFVILPLFLLLCGPEAWAKPSDYSDFQIQDEDWIDLKDTALFLNGNSSFNGTTNQQQTQPDDGVEAYDSSDNGGDSFGLNPDFKYNYETRLRKWTWDIPFSFSWSNDYEHKQIDTHPPSSQWDTNLDFSSTPNVSYTYYFDWMHLGFGLTPTLSSGKDTTTSTSSYGGSGYLSVGLGRIREGKYAYQAMQIVEDLALAGHLLRPVSPDDMQTLARIIAEERNRLVLDSRQATLEAVGRLFKFLTSRRYVAADNYLGLLIAEDDYRNIYGTSRPFGEQLELQAGMYYFRERTRTEWPADFDDFSESDSESHYTHVNLVYSHAQPLSLTWQYNFNATLDFEMNRSEYDQTYSKQTDEEEYDGNYYYNGTELRTDRTEIEQPLVIQPSASWSWYFIPNTRWEITFTERVYGQGWQEVQGSQVRTDNVWGSSENNLEQTNWIYALGNQLQLSGSYELNYDLKATASFHWNYSANFSRDSDPMTDHLVLDSDWAATFALQYQMF